MESNKDDTASHPVEWPRFLLQVFSEHYPSPPEINQQLQQCVAACLKSANSRSDSKVFYALLSWENAADTNLERKLFEKHQWRFGHRSMDTIIVPSVDFCQKLCAEGGMVKRSPKILSKSGRHGPFVRGSTLVLLLNEMARLLEPIIVNYTQATADSTHPFADIDVCEFRRTSSALREARRKKEQAEEYYDVLLQQCRDQTNENDCVTLPVIVAVVALLRLRENNTLFNKYRSNSICHPMAGNDDLPAMKTQHISKNDFSAMLMHLYLDGSSYQLDQIVKQLTQPLRGRRPVLYSKNSESSERSSEDITTNSKTVAPTDRAQTPHVSANSTNMNFNHPGNSSKQTTMCEFKRRLRESALSGLTSPEPDDSSSSSDDSAE